MHKKGANRGIICIAFAVGLILACFCPNEILIAALAIAVIVLGISFVKCH